MKQLNEKLIILTGGAGFIGSCILKYVNDRGLSNIIVVDHLERGDEWKNLVGKQFVDYLQKDELLPWLNTPGRNNDIQAIIHMGACSSTLEFDVNFLMQNNYRYTVHLAEYALKHNHRFIYASSAATYGDGQQGFVDNHDQLEDLRPLNPYGFSKHLFDLWAKGQGVLNKIVGLKFFNVFGPNESHKKRMASVVYNLLPQALNDGCVKLFKSNEPPVYRDGEQCRDFIYVLDIAKIVYEFLNNDASGIYNVGTGKPQTWNQVATAMFNAIKKPTNISYINMPQDLSGNYQNYTCADVEKLKNCLTNFHVTSLTDAVKDYVSNYLLTNRSY